MEKISKPAAHNRDRPNKAQYTVSRHWANLRESAQFPTSVKEVVTLLVKSRRSISNPMEVRISRGMYLVPLTSERRI
jgi:hypothetical protein